MKAHRCLFVSFLAIALMSPVAVAEVDAFRFDDTSLPPGWSVRETIRVPVHQLAGFAQRLGAKVEALENQVLDVGGLATRWNVISAETPGGAKRIEATMLGMRGKDYVQRDGRHVYEVPGNNVLLARAVFAAAGFSETEPVTYDVAFRTALVDEPDYTKVNRVFNHFLKLDAGTLDEAAARERIERDTVGWTFGTSLRLRATHKPFFEATWSFDPPPTRKRQDGDTILYTFDDPPTVFGIPYVDVKGTVRVRSRFEPGPDGQDGVPPAVGSPRWPTTPVAPLAAAAIQGQEGARARAVALLTALHAKVAYGGPMGSRDGVEQVLGRGAGRCWDKSDVYIALCRAAGLPARQVAGWVPALGAGHVWTEVHLAGEGWIPVDATTPWLGTGTDYVPFFLSEDGALPFVYLRMPRLSREEGP